MNRVVRIDLRQRADYTHKANLKTGRHGWLRLTPAYSVKVVEELILRCDRPVRVYDPFCGTATTALSAAYHGHEGVTTDINPFLVWLGKAKTACYSPAALEDAREACSRAVRMVGRRDVEPHVAPAIHNIARWWPRQALDFLCLLRAAIDATTEPGSQTRTLLMVAFCRTLIALSNAAFNHQSMSFKDDGQLPVDLNLDMAGMYAENLRFVLIGAAENPTGDACVLLGDARNPATVVEGTFDRVITSPPYANRMSYIRELRPYMYWLDFLKSGRDAGVLDWAAIGGTWGMATSRLNDWQRPDGALQNAALTAIVGEVAHADNKNGKLLATYITKYFDDMWLHIQGLSRVLTRSAEIHYIVGNSTFYDVMVPVERIYVVMLEQAGFEDVNCRAIRKRNSKKELIEFDVSAVWRG